MEPKIADTLPEKIVTEIKNPKTGKIRRRVQTKITGVSRTLQEPALDADIHNIMKKYVHTHGPIPMPKILETVNDFSDAADYQESLNRLIEAQEAFNSLPATTRADFQNNPANLISFLNDEKNYDKALEYGFISPEAHAARLEKLAKANPPPKPD